MVICSRVKKISCAIHRDCFEMVLEVIFMTVYRTSSLWSNPRFKRCQLLSRVCNGYVTIYFCDVVSYWHKLFGLSLWHLQDLRGRPEMTSRDFGRYLTHIPLVTLHHKRPDPLKNDVTMRWPPPFFQCQNYTNIEIFKIWYYSVRYLGANSNKC